MKIGFVDGYQRRCEKIDRMEAWHTWFAWHPVRINTYQFAWLERLERKGCYYPQLGWSFEYRERQAIERAAGI